jgi:hypothetical protein
MKLWLAVPVLAASIAVTGCDITGRTARRETAQWHKTYQLDPKGRVEISNVNGKIEVEPSTGNTVEVEATKKARGASSEAAKAALDRVTIAEDVSGGRIRVETKVARTSGFSFMNGGVQVEYRVKVPAGAEVKFATVNGGVDVTGLAGRIVAQTKNGGVTTHGVSASSTRAPPTAASTSICSACPRGASSWSARTAGSKSGCRKTRGRACRRASPTAASAPRTCCSTPAARTTAAISKAA